MEYQKTKWESTLDKIKIKLDNDRAVVKEVSDSITLDYITNLAMRTDDDIELAKEVRRILGVGESRRYQEKVHGHTYHYLPADNKL